MPPKKSVNPLKIETNEYRVIDPENVKKSVEIAVKPKPSVEELTVVEKEGKVVKKVRKSSGKTRGSKKFVKGVKSVEFKEIKLNPKGYVLVITEKPQAAGKIAAALSDGKDRKINKPGGVSYYEFERGGKRVVVGCAVGHLFSVAQTQRGTGYPIFDIGWFPNFEVRKNDFTQKYFNVIKGLVKGASEMVVASVDYNETTPIMENKEIKMVKIGEFIDDVIDNKKPISKIKVPCFDKKGIIRFKKLKKAIRHKTDEDLYEISLNYGRKVKLTSSHNIFTLKDKKISLIRTTDLKKGDSILCPNFLPKSDKEIKEINLLELKNFDKKKEIYICGEDISKILKKRVENKKRKEFPNNDKRVILSKMARKKIKDARLKLKFSTKKASEKAKLSQPLIVLWENGKRNPSIVNFKRYLHVLGLKSRDILKHCKIEKSSFENLLDHVYQKQFRNFSDLQRATLSLYDVKKEDTNSLNNAYIYGSKNRRNKLPIKLSITKEFVRMLGYFLAEGDINNNYRLRFSLGLRGYGHEEKIINELKDFCNKYNISSNNYLHKKIKHQIVTIDNTVLAMLLKNIFKIGDKATNKRIPPLIFNLSNELKLEFIRAYFLGDGSLSKNNISFNSASKELITDLSYLIMQLGIMPTISKSISKTSKGKNPSWKLIIANLPELKILKKIWEDHHKSHIILKRTITKKRSIKKDMENLSMIKIKDIKKVKNSNQYVYDFSVEGENFIAGQGGVCCHNTDFDIEGEVIGYNVVRFIGGQKDAKRMKFSSLTAGDIQEAYDNAHPTIEWGQAIAGETRHFLDWLYGINLSRALMSAVKSTGKFKIMSIGRVQGPALHLIVNKEKEIMAFKPTPYWQVFITVNDGENKLELKHNKDIVKKDELEKFKGLEGRKVEAVTKKSKQIIQPPAPFDLTSLQTEAYKFHSITPSITLQIAQKLYLAGLISYPRTSSQKIPEVMKPLGILKKLGKNFGKLVEHATKLKPIEGKKSDPAHPAIIPTGNFGKLEDQDEKIFNLIVKRFISCFCEDAELANKRVEVEVDPEISNEISGPETLENMEQKVSGGLRFAVRGMEILKKGWMNVYPVKMDEKEVKDMNGEVVIEKVKIEEKETKPPKRFSPASIITELESRGLGTKATRSSIVDTLYKRNYIKDKSIKATELGIKLIDSLDKHSPIIIDEKLTREIEKDMDIIRSAKKDLVGREKKIITKAEEVLTKISEDFKKKESEIGKELVAANEALWEQEKEDNKLGLKCPGCGKGEMIIKFTPRFRSYFVACDAYPDCRQTFSLPSNSLIKNDVKKECEYCKWPMIMSIKKGKRPWIFCFNPNCESRKPVDANGDTVKREARYVGQKDNVEKKEIEGVEEVEE